MSTIAACVSLVAIENLQGKLDVERKAHAEDCAQNPQAAQLATYFAAKCSSDQIFEHH